MATEKSAFNKKSFADLALRCSPYGLNISDPVAMILPTDCIFISKDVTGARDLYCDWVVATELLHYDYARKVGTVKGLNAFRVLARDLALFPIFSGIAHDAEACLDTAFDLSRKLTYLDALHAGLSEAYVLLEVLDKPESLVNSPGEIRKTLGLHWRIDIPIKKSINQLKTTYEEAMSTSMHKPHTDGYEIVRELLSTGISHKDAKEALIQAASNTTTGIDLLGVSYDELKSVTKTKPELYDPNHRLNLIIKKKNVLRMPPPEEFLLDIGKPIKLYMDRRLPKSFREYYITLSKAGGKQKKLVDKMQKSLIKLMNDDGHMQVLFDGFETSLGFLLIPYNVYGKYLPSYETLNTEHRISTLLECVNDEFKKEYIFKILKHDNFVTNEIMEVYKEVIGHLTRHPSISPEKKKLVESELAVISAIEMAIKSLEKHVHKHINLNEILTIDEIKQAQIPITKEIVDFWKGLVHFFENSLRYKKSKLKEIEKLFEQYSDLNSFDEL